MMWTDFADPAADLAARAEAGDQAAARQLLRMMAARVQDPDPLIAYMARCAAAWAPKYEENKWRAAFNISGRTPPAVIDLKRVEALAVYRLLRSWGCSRDDARFDTAEIFGVSSEWVKQLVDARTPDEELAAELLMRLGSGGDVVRAR